MAYNGYWAYGLTGGGNALDGIDGADLEDNDIALVVVSQSQFYVYVLDDDSGASEDSPSVITPNTNAGNKRWLLLGQILNAILTQQAEPTLSAGEATIYHSDGSSSDEDAGDIIAKSNVGGTEYKSWILSVGS